LEKLAVRYYPVNGVNFNKIAEKIIFSAIRTEIIPPRGSYRNELRKKKARPKISRALS
jgi:hypothetical protein